MTDIVKKSLSQLGCGIEENISMKTRTSFKIGGNAEIMINPDNIEQLKAIIKICKTNNVKTYQWNYITNDCYFLHIIYWSDDWKILRSSVEL